MGSEPYLIAQHFPGESTTTVDLVPIRQFLQGGRQTVLGSNGLNLRPLKKAVAMLPDYAKANDDTKNTLEEVFAILFHSQSAIREYVTNEWFSEHYEAPPGEGQKIDIAAVLGLVKRQTIARR